MATMEEIVKQADLLGYRGEKREVYLKQEFKLLAERQEKKEETERQERKEKEDAERRWIELSKTNKSYDKLKDLIVREQFMDACPEDLATSLREKDLPTLERVAKEADLFLKARNRNLCDQPRKVFPGNARPRIDFVRPLEPERKFNGGQRAWEAKTSVADQRSCFKCKKTGPFARYCTAVDSTTKKAGAGVVVNMTKVNTAEVRKPAEGPTIKVTDDLQSEVEGGMLKLTSGKSVPVMTNCAALRDLKKTRSLGLPVLKGEIGGREVDSSSPYASPVVVVKKKDGTNRVCIDYRRLNKLTIFDPQPMTPPADIFQGMEKNQYFSKIDLSKVYWQIPVRKEDILKTAFVTMDCHYEFLRMPFGMMNSGATLTRTVKKLMCGMDNVVDYIDDLLIHTETW
ncbi:Zinc finger protein [Plakobranchus ocellatus]|uniref:Zinc finger protein n=1 Tax=Plakobranchus ocellatus TaxID=259542 RepID=A0AAV4A718_9GAST|nr:Zinc finger protein [Plakobranchus ocellatus]